MKKEEQNKDMSRQRRFGSLKTQMVLSRRFFDPKIYEKSWLIELIEYVRNQGWLHLFEESTPIVFEH